MKAFISHCGQSGTYEAIHTSTPIIATPLFTDQHTTARILEARGVAIRLDIHNVTKKQILSALDAIFNDPKQVIVV